MSSFLRIKLTTAAAVTFSLDVDGEWRWDQPERVYRDAEEPPALESIRYSWQVLGGAILTPDGSHEGGWSAFNAAMAVLDSPTDLVVKAEILRVEAGVETVELALGTGAWEGFKIERLSCDGPWEISRRATHKIAFPVDMRFGAKRVFERDLTLDDDDSTIVTGVVGFEQTVTHEYDLAGLGTITAETIVTTRYGTDARVKARLLGKLPLPSTYWTYDTNGADGVDITAIDADNVTNTPRLPRQARAFSRVRQWGEPSGVTGPGTGPGTISYEDARSDDGIEIVRVVQAEAVGPGAEAWVRGRKPSGVQVEETYAKPTGRGFRAAWTIRTPKIEVAFTITDAAITGGAQDFGFEVAAGGFTPVEFNGGIAPWKLTIHLSIERRGGTGRKHELPLPPLLRDVWRLNRNASSEGWPKKQEQTATNVAARWVRDVTLVYESAVPPTNDPIEWLQDNAAAVVPSYFLAR